MMVRMLGSERDAEDAIQEIMIKLWQKRKILSAHPNVTGLVFVAARNHCLDLLKKRPVRLVDLDSAHDIASGDTGHERLVLRELSELIERILESSKLEHKEVLLMRDLDGMSYAEIAAVTDLTVEHLRVIVSRQRVYVQRHLKKNYSYEG